MAGGESQIEQYLPVTGPNGLILEFTRDHPDGEQISRKLRKDAHQVLRRWLAWDQKSNHVYR